MRIQATHDHEARGLDPYFTPFEAVRALLRIEAEHLPKVIWEPAAGNGAIVRPFRAAGYSVVASDIAEYGLEQCEAGVDYLSAKSSAPVGGVVTNPPYKLACEFATKALSEAPYVALLLRTNFLESTARMPFFRAFPPSRLWISSRRLPMMHRLGWEGPRAPSNTCFAWFVWDRFAKLHGQVKWFDWKTLEVA